MLFNSIEFLCFLPVVWVLYRSLKHRAQNLMLLAASYLFYGWWDVRFLFLIALSTALDYSCGLLLQRGYMTAKERWSASLSTVGAAFVFVTVQWKASSLADAFGSRFGWSIFIGSVLLVGVLNLLHLRIPITKAEPHQKRYVIASVCGNLAILGFFKYFNFFTESAIALLGTDSLAGRYRLDIVLPVGISFYTFQTMSYTIDIYRKQLKATESFTDMALYVAYFPQLVAGPIERAARLLPTLTRPRSPATYQTWRGLHLILYGLFKKVAIADGVAATVNQVYANGADPGWVDVVVGTVLFAVQIYCDFSGYSDIARGVSKLFGIELMVNFKTPYFSRSPSEFWRRWHISLSSWLRDYLYIPLGGNRGGISRTYRNLMTTMVLGGLWHGAAWNFVLWGAYQGAVLALDRARGELFPGAAKSASSGKKVLTTIIFFGITCYGWMLFRAQSWEQIAHFTSTVLTAQGQLGLTVAKPRLAAVLGLPVLCIFEWLEFWHDDDKFYRRLPLIVQAALYAMVIFVFILGTSNEPAQFIYFTF